MLAKILYSPEALDDLTGIKEYIRDKLLNPDAAIRVITKITKTIRKLEKTPQVGAPLTAVIGIDTDYRFVTSGNYLVFYRYCDKKCYIDRVLYKRRDYLSILFGDIAEKT